MAVFHSFDWDQSVRDVGQNIATFKNVNILYGRNYSGKTTLSRIFRALETGSLSQKYDAPEFEVSFDDESQVTQNTLYSHGQEIRVFNEDFVRENLSFIVDDEQSINSFAILGEDNANIEQQIEQLEIELGNVDEKSGLVGEKIDADEKYQRAFQDHKIKKSELEGKLRDKANRDIKHNKLYGNANYNLPKIEEDLLTVIKDSYLPLDDATLYTEHQLLDEKPKAEIPALPDFNLKYSDIDLTTRDLLEKKIQPSETIQDLLNDVVLAEWVRTGRKQHEGKREKCGFCGSVLPTDLWDKLDKHFNQDSEELRKDLTRLLELIESEKRRVPTLLQIKQSDFYSAFHKDIEELSEQFSIQAKLYCENLDFISEQVKNRKADIFTPIAFDSPDSNSDSLNDLRNKYEEVRSESNEFAKSLQTAQSQASIKLRLHEVYKFVKDINYEVELAAIDKLDNDLKSAKSFQAIKQENVTKKQKEINELKSKLKDERVGAEKVNYYLNNFFGHQYLSLESIEEVYEGATTGYRFEVFRNGNKAFHLSEGECSLIAFCYFMAKLQDIDTKGHRPIIWIDDPISSLDSNHIFFVYSLINAEIVKAKNYSQLFVSTHNLDFLKYLKRVSTDWKGKGENKRKIREFFLIERKENTSCIRLMPDYLKNYVTEFNYLFHQIFKCAKAETINDSNHQDFYSFGNNARKFMEIYLYYKYPNGLESDNKLREFFGEDNLPSLLTERVTNEYSHLAGAMERGAAPVEVAEMKSVANVILDKLRENDPPQYAAFLKSIGEDVVEEPA